MDVSQPFDFAAAARRDRRLARAVAMLGFALGGFFDGILLHQVLQWHHLLSGLRGAPWADLRVQVAADGLFHAAMYAIALAGLWKLWRLRTVTIAPGARERTAGAALAGFGLWHVVDGVLSHWVLGLHRVRMDVPDPLFWDVLWLVAFGLAPLFAGMALLRAAEPGSRPPYPGWQTLRARRGNGSGARWLVLAVTLAGLAAARGPGDGAFGETPNDLFEAASAATMTERLLAAPHRVLRGADEVLDAEEEEEAAPDDRVPDADAGLRSARGPMAPAAAPTQALLVVLRPGITPGRWLDALAALGGRVRWADASGAVWAVELPTAVGTLDLVARGALVTSRAGALAGCLGWTRAEAPGV
ncbi:DUF2243 domain-containing protein [Derxia gummosa]|uniref:DUF2243 domain-containing protein n=1 Tax=Derxia gummosa DSM 723 TaxID=1121388 RepID=A0A9U5C5N2_9BURK|nr:DUF2243 domain-containing protein [Derxia gummosa]